MPSFGSCIGGWRRDFISDCCCGLVVARYAGVLGICAMWSTGSLKRALGFTSVFSRGGGSPDCFPAFAGKQDCCLVWRRQPNQIG